MTMTLKPLKPTTYDPNVSDPRTKKRFTEVLAWCDSMRLTKRIQRINSGEIRRVFGNTRQRGLAEWLYENLLSQYDNYVVGKQSFAYRLRRRGYKKLYRMLGQTPPSDVDVVTRKYCALVNGTEVPEYRDYGDRRYHPIQNIKREIRKQAFADWWDYDIEACATTLVHQYAVQHHRFVYRDASPDEPFPAVARTIQDKAAVRAHIAALTGLDIKKAKELMAAMLFRANMAPFHKAKLFSLLDCDLERHQRLINDEFVKAFRADVKAMWRMARYRDLRERALQLFDGKQSAKRPTKSSKHRMAIYLRLERRVIDAMLDHLSDSGTPVILMHDGFMSRKQISADDLVRAVLDRTGFLVRLSEARFGAATDIDGDPDVVEVFGKDAGEVDDELDDA